MEYASPNGWGARRNCSREGARGGRGRGGPVRRAGSQVRSGGGLEPAGRGPRLRSLQPVRVHGRQCRRLSALRLRGDARRHLRAWRRFHPDRHLRIRGRRFGVRHVQRQSRSTAAGRNAWGGRPGHAAPGHLRQGPLLCGVGRQPGQRHTPALRAFSAAREKLLPSSAAVPAALAWFPTDGQKSVRLIPESVLGLRLLKRGYVAEYEFGKAFVVQESSPEAAAAVMDKLRARFDVGQASQPVIPMQLTDRYLGRLYFIQKGPYIVGYANVAEGHDPSALASALAARLP